MKLWERLCGKNSNPQPKVPLGELTEEEKFQILEKLITEVENNGKKELKYYKFPGTSYSFLYKGCFFAIWTDYHWHRKPKIYELNIGNECKIEHERVNHLVKLLADADSNERKLESIAKQEYIRKNLL